MIYTICKYTPTELLASFGQTCTVLDRIPECFDRAEQTAHPNLCGFGKSVLEAVLSGGVRELVLVNCCDTIRRVYDVLQRTGACDFLFLMDLPHEACGCSRALLTGELNRLLNTYATYSGMEFSLPKFQAAFRTNAKNCGPYVGILGVRVGRDLERMMARCFSLPVRNLTCTQGRCLNGDSVRAAGTLESALDAYAAELLHQVPCRRMDDETARQALYRDPDLRGIVYHTIKFCDFYGFEYAEIRRQMDVPILKVETDYTRQSQGQILTRLEAFSETVSGPAPETGGSKLPTEGVFFVAGIDSGSTSTDVVILNQDKKIVGTSIVPTGAGASAGAEKSLEAALRSAGLRQDQLARTVATGYGRANLGGGLEQSVTEITCHARGAFFLNPKIRTIIDIGGQDSKVIRIDGTGHVINFVMNDKCAAGTGRFLEMMARTLGMGLEEMSRTGLTCREDITISSMCTVFAESEVVSLVAQNKDVSDIVHGLNKSVAAKTAALAARLGMEGDYCMTGGVAKNAGVVKALEEKLGVSLFISDEAQLCGALGAALLAFDL
ncbi:MAG: acyl-CoA dehydratase activase [Intestinimonas sp.]|jgi:predicted CoA-substrate-specific enzyme activase|nr:acyl-CoA dehydratase activase [Intestinimonas sp.]